MKKINIIITIFILLFLLSCISACSRRNIKETQLIKDLNYENEIQNCFSVGYGNDSEFQIIECNISDTEYDKENKETIVYCSAIAENDYFHVELDIKADYIKNNLDSISYDVDSVKAISAPDKDFMEDMIKQAIKKNKKFSYGIPYDDGIGTRYYYLYSDNNDFDVIDIDLASNGTYAKLNCCYTSDNTKYYGYFEIIFDNKGWHSIDDSLLSDIQFLHMILTKVDFDFATKAVGSFYHSYEGEYSNLIIHNISGNFITYSLISNDDFWEINEIETGENITTLFNPDTGEFAEIHYDIEGDFWEHGSVELNRK